mmetsp:Transcript_25640/g.71652  ORF Transcript_25640/g.71652 Transcript_25640/m.71652 type:complete len:245 (+) Transcript_25640:1562-2296(+)
MCVSVVWIILILIPTRYLLLAIGTSQFVAGFVSKQMRTYKQRGSAKSAVSSSKAKKKPDAKSKSSPLLVVLQNMIRSLPTNEDLRMTYFWENRLVVAEFLKKRRMARQQSRLRKLCWQASWYSEVRLRSNTILDVAKNSDPNNSMNWTDAFAILQGHRLLWWDDITAFDAGEHPVGSLYLSGHSGLTNPSPLEMRNIPADELSKLVSIFGKGTADQIRVTILCNSEADKERLKNAVLEASLKDD